MILFCLPIIGSSFILSIKKFDVDNLEDIKYSIFHRVAGTFTRAAMPVPQEF